MAELTVTSTADSGEGTLRAAISAAQDGDVILFDADVFPIGQTTSILLSSQLVVAKSISIYGGEADGNGGYTSGSVKRCYVYREVESVKTKVYVDDENPAQSGETVLFENVCRVALDGQGAVRCIYSELSKPVTFAISGINFINGASVTSSGGAVFVNSNSIFTLTDCAFNTCSAAQTGGAVYLASNATITLVHCNTYNTTATSNGGGVYSGTDSTTNLSNCCFDSCSSTTTGGAVYSVVNSDVVCVKCVFYYCNSGLGGAIYKSGTNDFVVDECAFDGCSANNGGAVYSMGDDAREFADCVFKNCSANAIGAVIYARGTSQNEFDGCSFIGCSATTYGGVLYSIEESQTEFVGCRFTSCSANYGGVARTEGYSRNGFVSCSFTSCNAISSGVLHAANHSQNTVVDCEFDECSATSSAGAAYLEVLSQNSFNSCRFTLCSGVAGGAIRTAGCSQNAFRDCRFESCSSSNGGAFYTGANSNNTFDNCAFVGCSATNNGGAGRSLTNAQNRFVNCAFEECSATNNGGAIYSDSNAQNTFDGQCVFKNCSASNGSGVYDNSLRWSNPDSATFENCEYASMRLPSQQTVRYFTTTADSGDGSLRAAIAAANSNDIIQPDPTVFVNGAIININLSSAIVVNKRLYIRGAGRRIVLDGQGASRVLTISNSTCALIVSDVDIVNGRDVGTNGAPIYITGAAGLIFIRSNIAGNYGVRVFYATDAAGTRFVSCFIQGNVGTSALSNATYVAYNSTIAGNYVGGVAKEFPATSTRTVNSINENVYSNVGFVSAPPDSLAEANWNKDLWKSWNLSLTNESDYASGAEELNEIDALITGDDANYDYEGFPRKPYKTTEQLGGALGAFEMRGNAKLVLNANDSGAGSLRQTITSAQDGDAILFSYAFFPKNETTAILLSSTLSVAKTVEIDGDGRVALDGQNSIRVCAMGVADKSPHVKNLTIQNGAYANGAGLLFQGGTPIATNCIIENCSATSSCGGVYGYSNAVATLNNCDIRYNTAANNAGGVYANNTSQLTFNDCEIHGNSAVNNGGGAYVASAASVVFNNCRIYENHIDSNGGALFTSGGTAAFNNCIVNNNTTDANDQTLKDVCVNNGSVDISDSNIDVLRFYGATALHVSGAITTVGTLRIIANNNVAATVNIDDGAALTITDAATIPSGSTFTSPGIGMIGKGSGVDLSSATLTNVLVCEIGAGVVSVSGTKIGDCYTINIASTDATKPVLIAYQSDGDDEWTIADGSFVGPTYQTRSDEDLAFRVFDGESLYSVTVKVYGLYYAMKERVSVGYIMASANGGYLKTSSTAGYLQ